MRASPSEVGDSFNASANLVAIVGIHASHGPRCQHYHFGIQPALR
jgi:hypothetical protein